MAIKSLIEEETRIKKLRSFLREELALQVLLMKVYEGPAMIADK